MAKLKDDKTYNKPKAIILLIAVIISFVGGLASYNYVSNDILNIKIVATGEKNALSLGNNIRISSVTADPGDKREHIYSPREFLLSDNWQTDADNDLLTCYNSSDACEALLKIPIAQSLKIDFVSELGSGIVEIYIDDELVERIDLYSDTDWSIVTKKYDIENTLDNVIYVLALMLALICLISAALLVKEFHKAIGKGLKTIPLKRAVSTGLFLVFIYVIIFTVFQSVVFRNVDGENTNIVITATGDKNINSLSSNVRISEIYINYERYDFSEVKLTDGWKYDGIDHLLYNYGSISPASIIIPANNVKTLDINFVKEVGSGIAEVSLGNRSIYTVDLYKNCRWDNKTVRYEISSFIRPYKSYGSFLILFIAGIVLSAVFKKEKYSKLFKAVNFITVNIIISLLLYCIIIIVQRESIVDSALWAYNNTNYFVDGLCILSCINIALASVLKKHSRALVVLVPVSMIFLTINYFKLKFRSMPFLPWDILLAKAAATVVGNFELKPSVYLVLGIIAAAILVGAVIMIQKRFIKTYLSPLQRLLTGGAALMLLVFYMYGYLFNVSVNLFDVKDFYLERGFIGAFFENMQYLMPIEEPENYTEEKMEQIYNNIVSNNKSEKGKSPNIIVIMSESFWDIERVEELGFNEEIFPTYRELQRSSLTGELLTNVYGGGTVNSEFEALTGFSVAALPTEYMPYQRCLRQGFFSINSYLKKSGYDTLAIHPFDKTNYNRNTAYEYFGFDDVLWEEDFDKDADRMRNYISDYALTEKIISEYEKHNNDSDAPWFNLSVSMQNHGGYWESSIDSDKSLDIDVSKFNEESQGSIKDLAIGLHYADLALGSLIDYFKTQNEPTIIIMFGDHMSDAGPIGKTLLEQSSLIGSDNADNSGKSTEGLKTDSIYQQRRVPFMAWSNMGNTPKSYGVIDVPQLLPTVFSEYGIDMPLYFKYLKSTQTVYTACASNIVVNPDGSYNSVSEMTDEQKSLYDQRWLIEYDYIFGENYIEKLFEE